MRTMLALALIGGCSGKDDGTTVTGTDDTGTPHTTDTATETTLPGADLVVTPDAVYTITPDYRLDTLDIRASFDVLLSWSALTTDGWGDPIDPVAIPSAFLLEILAKPEDLPARFAADDLGNDLISTWTLDTYGDVSAHISDFSVEVGGVPEPFDPDPYLVQNPSKSWVLGFGSSDGLRPDLRAMVALAPQDAGTETSVTVDPFSSTFGYQASLGGTPLVTAEGWDLYTIDWDAVTTDALGKPYDDQQGDVLFLGRFDGVAAADLDASLLRWDTTADAWYTMDVARETSARLDLAKDSTGTAFPGFTPGATWVVGVRCSTCLTPFPLWVATVDVSSRDVTARTGG